MVHNATRAYCCLIPNGSKICCPGTFRSQENHPKSWSKEVKAKDISIMKEETGVSLQVNSLFELFPITPFSCY